MEAWKDGHHFRCTDKHRHRFSIGTVGSILAIPLARLSSMNVQDGLDKSVRLHSE